MKSPTWCVMPFSHMNIKPYGYVGACWRNLTDLGNYQKQSLSSIWNGQGFQDLRNQLINGERPEGCRSCWDMEAAGVFSTRQQCNESYRDFADTMGPLSSVCPSKYASVEIRFSNECNLMCRHCGPDNSSKWEQATKRSPVLEKLFFDHLGRPLATPSVRLSQDIVDELCRDILPRADHVLITGGEPLLQKAHFDMLKALDASAAGKTLEYNSNLHNIQYRGESFIDYWRKYKKVSLRISLDGDDKIYPYFRTNGDLNAVLNNINVIKEGFKEDEDRLFLQATCTTSIYQITRLVDIIKFINSLGVYFHTSLVQYPLAINIQRLPRSMREEASAKLSQFLNAFEKDEDFWKNSFWRNPARRQRQARRIYRYAGRCLTYLCASKYKDEKMDAGSKEWIEAIDNDQGTSFLEVYPEFTPYW